MEILLALIFILHIAIYNILNERIKYSYETSGYIIAVKAY
ncbi:hypothetical protein LY54_01168 [Salegentibacter mishustinae]|nr:hypothetical protein LY54_01168 [Salegentibacter mishustinae]